MNISTNDLSSSLNALLLSQSQSSQSSQANNLASALAATDSSGSDSSGDTASLGNSASSSGSQLLSSGVQTATSFVQASESSLSTISGLLAQMAKLAADASSSSTSQTQVQSDTKQYNALRDQLRAAVGGTTADIGGSADTAASASLNGSALFGSNASSFTIGTGLDSSPTLTVNGVNLRQGAFLSLIKQDSSGNYTSGISDPGTASAISAAQQQVSAGASTLSASDERLSATLATLQVQSVNLASVFSSIDADSQAAQYNILGNSSSSLSTQANLSSSSVLGLLQGA